jgi:hypothetical protein
MRANRRALLAALLLPSSSRQGMNQGMQRLQWSRYGFEAPALPLSASALPTLLVCPLTLQEPTGCSCGFQASLQ